jgi:hypothetical protein
MDVNMVFTVLAEFRVPMEDVMELALGAERAVFEKPENPGALGWNTNRTHAH